jgi:hypothetical protein
VRLTFSSSVRRGARTGLQHLVLPVANLERRICLDLRPDAAQPRGRPLWRVQHGSVLLHGHGSSYVLLAASKERGRADCVRDLLRVL